MKGVYILLMNLDNDKKIKIGSLGLIKFKKGKYLYVGSAQNGIEQRVRRHLRKKKKKFWHIDYFLGNAEIKEVFVKKADKSEEEKIAKKLEKCAESINQFGSSDSKARSHLFRVKNFDYKKYGFKRF